MPGESSAQRIALSELERGLGESPAQHPMATVSAGAVACYHVTHSCLLVGTRLGATAANS